MAKINLLPWREELRAEQTRQFVTMLGLFAFLTITLVAAVHLNIAGQINHQQFRNGTLTKEITQLDIALKEIDALEETKQELLARMEVIQSLQHQRPQIVHLFDAFVRTVPEGIYLTSIKQSGKALTINGVAESNGRVSAYMRNIDTSDWMATPKLTVIETKKGSMGSSIFALTTSQSSPEGEGEGEDGDNN
ncbi:MAG: PilN domain-containing protein [Gammaproteobacteria bacterium]|nr:PilN domain-containing protein [Gammaproteobacteria bacterium]MCK5262857.1 PilN domain-containing protein [Gammaproteobacteria bacterium]